MKKHLFDSKQADYLWAKCDDGIGTSKLLSEIYNNVPKRLRNVRIRTLEFHTIEADEKTRKEVLAWLNR